MLIAEGVAGPDKSGNATSPPSPVSSETSIEHADYKSKLAQIRNIYHCELEKYDQVTVVHPLQSSIETLFYSGLQRVHNPRDELTEGTVPHQTHHTQGDRPDGQHHQ